MSKKFTLSTAIMALGLAASGWAEPQIQTTLDGRTLQFDQPALMQDGRVMVPLRGIFESLGADVLFDRNTRTIKATKGDRVVELALGSREAVINGQMSYLDVPANTLGGRTLVPLRFVSEALGAEVKWSPASRTVALTSNGQPTANQPDEQPQANADLEISGLAHNARRQLQSGDELVVTFNGESGGRASFDLLGVINNVPMREISNGRYEGTLRVRDDMQVDRGTLVARLRKNGKEATSESRRAVSINGYDNGSANNNNNNNNNFNVQPPQGSTVNTQRPTVFANMDGNLVPGSVRVFLDGQDVTNQASINGNSVRYVPGYDLQNGDHRVSIQGQARNGRMLSRDWNFQVYPQGLSNNGAPMINVSNLANGANVPGVFTISGQTTPFAQVEIEAQAQRSLIPGVIGYQDKLATVSRQADANGRFNIQMDVSAVPVNSRVDLRIQSSDQQGRVSGPTTLNVFRR